MPLATPGSPIEGTTMKLAGFLLLLSGWLLVVAALVMLPSPGPRAVFVLAGVAVEVLGLALAARSHRAFAEEDQG
jgi:membrane-bound ClpP family serine protease